MQRRGPVPESVASCRGLAQQGVAAMQEGQWGEAEQKFSQSVEACSTDVDARRLYAEALWRRGATTQAIHQLETGLALAPNDVDLTVRAGDMHLKLGNQDQAKILADRAIHLSSRNADAWALRSRVMLAEGDGQQSLVDLHRALSYAPNSPHLLIELAEHYRQRDQPQRALSTLLEAAELYHPGEEPQHLLYLSGLAYTALARYDDAVETLYAASCRGPLSAELLYRLSLAEQYSGRPSAALDNVRQALAIDPSHAESQQLAQRLELVVRQGADGPRRY